MIGGWKNVMDLAFVPAITRELFKPVMNLVLYHGAKFPTYLVHRHPLRELIDPILTVTSLSS